MGIYDRKVKAGSELTGSNTRRSYRDMPELLRRYLRPIVIFASVILGGVVFFSIGSFFKQKSLNAESDMAYFALKGNNGGVNSPGSLETLNEHYRKKGAGPDSVRLASLFFHEGKTDESLELYRNISKNAEHNITKSIGLLGMGYSLEAKGKFQQAIDKFRQIKSTAILKDYQYLAALGVARCYEELNETQKALEVYNRIEQEFGQIQDKDFIKSRVAVLGP